MTQHPLKTPPIIEGVFGIRPDETQKALEVDAFKELVNKLAWALGSAYGKPYATRRNRARQIAVDIAMKVVAQEGWPSKIKR